MAIVIKRVAKAPRPDPVVEPANDVACEELSKDAEIAELAIRKLIRRLAIKAAREDHAASLSR